MISKSVARASDDESWISALIPPTGPVRYDTWYFNRDGSDGYLRRQIYSMTVWIYEGIYFGLMSTSTSIRASISEGRETDVVTRA